MSWFTRKYYPGTKYITPERVASDYPSRMIRTVEKELQRNLELQLKYGRLSPEANIIHTQLLKETQMRLRREYEARDRLSKSFQAKLETDFRKRGSAAFLGVPRKALLAAISGATLQRGTKVDAQRRAVAAKASAADRRKFNPAPQEVQNPRTVFGTDAHLSVNSLGRHQFKIPNLVVPCIQRAVRREVMFAKKKAGKGHRVPHRQNPHSFIWC